MSKKEEEKYLFDLFIEKLTRSKVASFDLSKSKSELFIDFYKRVSQLKKAYELKEIALEVFKTYYEQTSEDIVKYVNFNSADLYKSEKNSNANKFGYSNIDLIAKFINDYILLPEEAKFSDGNNTKDILALKKYIDNLIASRLTHIYGNHVFLYLKDTDIKNNGIGYALENMGFTKSCEKFYLNYNYIHADLKEKYKELLIDSYKAYASNLRQYVEKLPKNVDSSVFYTRWELMKEYSKAFEDLLPSTFKKTKEYKDLQEETKFLFDYEVYGEYFGNLTLQGKSGKEYLKYREALKNKDQLKNSNEMADLLALSHRVTMALNIKDENGKNYPANYFVLTDIHPSDFFHLILEYEKLCSREEAVIFAAAKTAIRRSFNFTVTNTIRNNTGRCFDVARCMDKDYSYKTGNASRVGYTCNEKRLVEDIIKKNKLPRYETCILSVARAVAEGRQPINLDGSSKKHAAEKQL